MITSYGVDDGNGQQLARGIEPDRAHQIAQNIANQLGETVYLYQHGSDEVVAVEPTEPSES